MFRLAAILPLLALLGGTPQPTLLVEASRNTDYTGRGNTNEPLLEITIQAESPCRLKAVDVLLDADASDVSRLTLMHDGRVVGKARVKDGRSEYRLRCRRRVSDVQTLQVCADIRPDAAEGGRVTADILGIACGGRTLCAPVPEEGAREILLCRRRLFAPGMYGSRSWRIPALLQLSDGTLLAVNDRRNCSVMDLPGQIDVVCSYSTDHGMTWSSPAYIHKSGGFMDGCGDPALAELPDGTVVCLFCGSETFSKSSVDNPQRSFFCISRDHGRTWGEKREITSVIWGPEAENPECTTYHSNFFSSGNALVLKRGAHKGRLVVAGVMAGPDGGLDNRAIYTDDLEHWHVSALACDDGDEAKVVELLDGSILMSVRTYGERKWTISSDGGATWGPCGQWQDMCVINCNGDLIRYDDSLLLHSIPYSMKRHDVSILLSRDEGRTWPERKLIFRGPSQYSSLTVLDDGTIGAYVEKDHQDVELWYLNFSLEWLQGKGSDPDPAGALKGVRLWEGGPLWADCNLGASSPWKAGSFIPKDGDGLKNALGDAWRLPSLEECRALRDSCTWTWTSVRGMEGYEVQGPCGSIFLPAGGYMSRNVSRRDFNALGHYWCAESEYYFNSQYKGDGFGRGADNGLTVRPVAR